MPGVVDDPDPDDPRTVTGTITGPDNTGGSHVRGAPPQRRLTTPSAVMLAAVAALVAAVLLVGRDYSEVPEQAQVSDPAPSTERSFTAGPALVRGTGTPMFAGARDVPVTVTLPPGWLVEDTFVSKNGDGYGLAFYHVVNTYADPCRWELLDPPVGPTVDDLTRALAESAAWQAGEPSDVIVDGYGGKHMTFTLPGFDPQDCLRFGLFKDADPPSGAAEGIHPNLWALGPHQQNEVWILDVEGRRLVILAATFPTTPAEDVADLEAMVASVRIDPPGPTGDAFERSS